MGYSPYKILIAVWGSSSYNPFRQKEYLIIYMVVDISGKATGIEFSLKKRPSSAIRPAMCQICCFIRWNHIFPFQHSLLLLTALCMNPKA